MIAMLGLLAVFVTFQPAGEAPQVALPLGVIGQVAANGWQVVYTQKSVPGTEHNRAQSFDRVFYCGKLGDKMGRVIWQERTTGSHLHLLLLHLLPDGTAIASTYSHKLLWIGPNDPPAKRGDGVQLFLPGEKDELVLLNATNNGLLVYSSRLNTNVQVYFIPLEGSKPLIDKRVKVSERNANLIWRTDSWFHVSDDWIVWDLSAFNPRTGKRWTLPIKEKETTFLGLDGSLVVVMHKVVVNSKYVAKAVVFDLATEKQIAEFPIEPETIMPVVHRGVGYFYTPIPLKEGERDSKAEMVAYALTKPGEPLLRKVMPGSLARSHLTVIHTATGFLLPGGPPEVEWVERPKK